MLKRDTVFECFGGVFRAASVSGLSTGNGSLSSILIQMERRCNRAKDCPFGNRLDQDIRRKFPALMAGALVIAGQEYHRHSKGGQFGGDGDAVDHSLQADVDQ